MTTFPTPGSPVRGSRTGTPLMAAFDLLGRRWSMGVIWRLCTDGPATFRALQDRCEGVSPSVLNARLKELRAARLIRKGPAGYEATERGEALFRLLTPMREWAHGWAADLEAAEAGGSLPDETGPSGG